MRPEQHSPNNQAVSSHPGNSDDQSDSLGSKELKQMQQFHSDQSWGELDQLEQHLFNGSYQEQTPETQPKKLKKKDQQATKILEIQQQERWLQNFRKTKLTQFRDPFEKQTLGLNSKKIIKALQEGINNSTSINPITKMVGIKPVKVLNKWKVNEQFQWFINYIENSQIPEPWKVQHTTFMNGEESSQFNREREEH